MDTNFTRGATYKIWKGKNVQNSARFVATFDFGRKSLERINMSTIRKVPDQLHFIPCCAKENLVNFGAQTKKL